MKKKLIVLGVIIIILVGTAVGVIAKQYRTKEDNDFFNAAKKIKTDKTVVAIVNKDKIYQYQIDFKKSSQLLSQKNAEDSGLDASQITVQSDDEILEELVRNTVVLQESKKQKLTAKYSDAQKYIKSNYDAIMANDDDNSRFLKEYMAELDLSKNEYLKQASEAYQNTMTRENFYNAFADKNSESTETLQTQYDQYVSQLVNEAIIDYK